MSPLVYVLLGVSITSLAVYVTALLRLMTQRHHKGLVRTAVCRVVAACLYLIIAVFTVASRGGVAPGALAVFTAVQAMWQLNAIADALQTRRENRVGSLAARGALEYRVSLRSRQRSGNVR